MGDPIRELTGEVGELKGRFDTFEKNMDSGFQDLGHKIDKLSTEGCTVGKNNAAMIHANRKRVGTLFVWLGAVTLFCVVVGVMIFGPDKVLEFLN